MKNLIVLIIFGVCLGASFESTAQMSKKEKKEWKKRTKQLTPEKYKKLLDQNKALQSQVSSLKTELSKTDDKLAEKDEQILNYQSQVADLRQELSKSQSAKPVTKTVAPTPVVTPSDDDKGVVFKVQIGAFRQKDLSKYLNNAKNFNGEEENGVRKYTIGVFRDYWEANDFKKYLREMGVKDAWIVGYEDGQRVPMKKLLENVSKPK